MWNRDVTQFVRRARSTPSPIHRVTSITRAINLRRYCAVCADSTCLSPTLPRPTPAPLVRLCRGVRVSQRLRNLCLSRYLLLTFCIPLLSTPCVRQWHNACIYNNARGCARNLSYPSQGHVIAGDRDRKDVFTFVLAHIRKHSGSIVEHLSWVRDLAIESNLYFDATRRK